MAETSATRQAAQARVMKGPYKSQPLGKQGKNYNFGPGPNTRYSPFYKGTQKD